MSREELLEQAREVIAIWERWGTGDEPPDVLAARATIRLLGRKRLWFLRTS